MIVPTYNSRMQSIVEYSQSINDRIFCLKEAMFNEEDTLFARVLEEIWSDLDLVLRVEEDWLERSEEEMRKFKEGFAYEPRNETDSVPRKKPKLHSVEPKRNKCPFGQDSGYSV